jgi:DNA polymerase I
LAQDTLLLIDANSILNRAFFGLTGRDVLRAPDGTPTNALYAFLTIYWKFLQDTGASLACAAFDLKGPTFRHLQYPAYKALRRPMPDDLAVQVPLIKEILDAMGVAHLEKEGYEADDLIGTVSRQAAASGCRVIVLTGDRDALQLVDEQVEILVPTTRSGRTETERYDLAAVRERYGLLPAQMIELKAIMGDASDNIPGVKGIGEKGALSLIQAYGSLEAVYAAIVEIAKEKPAIGAKLVQDHDIAYQSRWLATIDRNVPIEVPLESLRLHPMDPEKVAPVFRRLGFRSFLDRFSLRPKEASLTAHGVSSPDVGLSALKDALREFPGPKGLSTGHDKSCSVSFHGGPVVILSSGQVLEGLSEVLGRAAPEGTSRVVADLACQDSKAFLKGPVAEAMPEVDFSRRLFDPGIAAYLLDSGSTRKGLASLYETMTGQPPVAFGPDAPPPSAQSRNPQPQTDLFSLGLADPSASAGTPDDGRPSQASLDAAAEAVEARVVAELQRAAIDERKLRYLFEEVEMPLARVLADMERVGFRVDAGILGSLSDLLRRRQVELEEEIHRLCGTPFNINSPKQLADVLFVRLSLPAARKTATGYSTDSDVLEAISDRHAAVPMILEYRQVSKLRSTFVDGLLRLVSPTDGRVHSTFHQTATATGRLSSSDPNLQNIPVRMEQGREIRRAFVPDPGMRLVDADYSQIELRLMAHYSGDEDMIRAFREHVDIHAETAAKVFHVPLAQVTPLMRTRAKAVNFGILYGIGEYSLSRDIGSSLQEAKHIIEDYNRQFPAIREYLERTIAEAKRTGYVETLFGRRRTLPELVSPNRSVRSFGERAAMNTPLQGTAADIIKIAMVRTSDTLRARGLKTRIVLQVHDELILESPAEEVAEASRILKDCMENAAELAVPLQVDVHAGASWYETK